MFPRLLTHEDLGEFLGATVDGSEIRDQLTSWGEGRWNPMTYRVLAPSQVVGLWDFWTINSISMEWFLLEGGFGKWNHPLLVVLYYLILIPGRWQFKYLLSFSWGNDPIWRAYVSFMGWNNHLVFLFGMSCYFLGVCFSVVIGHSLDGKEKIEISVPPVLSVVDRCWSDLPGVIKWPELAESNTTNVLSFWVICLGPIIMLCWGLYFHDPCIPLQHFEN